MRKQENLICLYLVHLNHYLTCSNCSSFKPKHLRVDRDSPTCTFVRYLYNDGHPTTWENHLFDLFVGGYTLIFDRLETIPKISVKWSPSSPSWNRNGKHSFSSEPLPTNVAWWLTFFSGWKQPINSVFAWVGKSRCQTSKDLGNPTRSVGMTRRSKRSVEFGDNSLQCPHRLPKVCPSYPSFIFQTQPNCFAELLKFFCAQLAVFTICFQYINQ